MPKNLLNVLLNLAGKVVMAVYSAVTFMHSRLQVINSGLWKGHAQIKDRYYTFLLSIFLCVLELRLQQCSVHYHRHSFG